MESKHHLKKKCGRPAANAVTRKGGGGGGGRERGIYLGDRSIHLNFPPPRCWKMPSKKKQNRDLIIIKLLGLISKVCICCLMCPYASCCLADIGRVQCLSKGDYHSARFTLWMMVSGVCIFPPCGVGGIYPQPSGKKNLPKRWQTHTSLGQVFWWSQRFTTFSYHLDSYSAYHTESNHQSIIHQADLLLIPMIKILISLMDCLMEYNQYFCALYLPTN